MGHLSTALCLDIMYGQRTYATEAKNKHILRYRIHSTLVGHTVNIFLSIYISGHSSYRYLILLSVS